MADGRTQGRRTKKKLKIEAFFAPDENGYSDWKTVEEIEASGLSWTTNGNCRHGAYLGYKRCRWQVDRVSGDRSRIKRLRMNGWADQSTRVSNGIDASVREELGRRDQRCNLSLLPVPKDAVEVDHRYGYKAHPTYIARYASGQQHVDDFQLLHRAQNVAKRELCVVCVRDQRRPAHPELGYAIGGEALEGDDPCRGCFLAEPELYRGVPVTVRPI